MAACQWAGASPTSSASRRTSYCRSQILESIRLHECSRSTLSPLTSDARAQRALIQHTAHNIVFLQHTVTSIFFNFVLLTFWPFEVEATVCEIIGIGSMCFWCMCVSVFGCILKLLFESLAFLKLPMNHYLFVCLLIDTGCVDSVVVQSCLLIMYCVHLPIKFFGSTNFVWLSIQKINLAGNQVNVRLL